MVKLYEIDERHIGAIERLKVSEEQRKFVPSPEGIIARAYLHRNNEGTVYASVVEDELVGLTMMYNLDEEPACYCLMEMMIDEKYQNKGYGQETLKKIIEKYSENPKYPVIELSVDRENVGAIHTYEKVGFVDSGYVDPDVPQYVNMVYKLK